MLFRGEHRFERSFSSRPNREFDEPRHEFSRSMSTDNWRDAKQNEEVVENRQDDENSWRRAGPKCKTISKLHIC